ncbi:hypothetical protein PRBEI_2000424500 [Prionailurus iriomotensis]
MGLLSTLMKNTLKPFTKISIFTLDTLASPNLPKIGDDLKEYELLGTYAFNFILKNSLGGGSTTSLRSDPRMSEIPQVETVVGLNKPY